MDHSGGNFVVFRGDGFGNNGDYHNRNYNNESYQNKPRGGYKMRGYSFNNRFEGGYRFNNRGRGGFVRRNKPYEDRTEYFEHRGYNNYKEHSYNKKELKKTHIFLTPQTFCASFFMYQPGDNKISSLEHEEIIFKLLYDQEVKKKTHLLNFLSGETTDNNITFEGIEMGPEHQLGWSAMPYDSFSHMLNNKEDSFNIHMIQ
jgi:hypothetical protein